MIHWLRAADRGRSAPESQKDELLDETTTECDAVRHWRDERDGSLLGYA